MFRRRSLYHKCCIVILYDMRLFYNTIWKERDDFSLIVIDNKIGFHNMNQVYSTEPRSIFLVVNYFSRKYHWPKQVYTISNVCFLVSFLYYRIYNYYINIMLNENYSDCVIQMDPLYVRITKFIMNIGVYGLFGLNLYWLTIVIKMFYKSFLKHLTVKHAEYSLLYSYFLCLMTTIFGYTVWCLCEWFILLYIVSVS